MTWQLLHTMNTPQTLSNMTSIIRRLSSLYCIMVGHMASRHFIQLLCFISVVHFAILVQIIHPYSLLWFWFCFLMSFISPLKFKAWLMENPQTNECIYVGLVGFTYHYNKEAFLSIRAKSLLLLWYLHVGKSHHITSTHPNTWSASRRIWCNGFICLVWSMLL